MRTIILILLILVAVFDVSSCCSAGTEGGSGPIANGVSPDASASEPGRVDEPKFSDYRRKVFEGEIKPVDLDSHPKAEMFKTRFEEAMNEGVNFAGKYVFASWGCGSGCVMGAIIDAENGKVYFPEELQGMGFGIEGEEVADEPIEFQKDSSLLIVRGILGGEELNSVSNLNWIGEKFERVGNG